MTVRVRDVLLIDIVFAGVDLLANPVDVQRCGTAFGSEIVPDGAILAPPPGPGMPPVQGQSLRVPRERILIETSVARTRFVKEYPFDLDDALPIVRLARLAVPSESSLPAPSACGFNIHLVYEQDSGETAKRYLARRLFDYRRLLAETWELSGGFGTLVFVDDSVRWTVKVEPRFQDEHTPLVFLDINVHVSASGFPSDEELGTWLTNLWKRSHTLIEAIDNE